MTMLIASGCAGTKTMVGIDDAKASAANDYNAKASDLRQQIDDIRSMERPGGNSTMNDYRLWLDRYGQQVNNTWDLYNETAKAGNTYLRELDSRSDMYKNITAAIVAFKNDVHALESDYRQAVGDTGAFQARLEDRLAALSTYKDALNATVSAYNDLVGFSNSTKISSMGDYSTYINGFRGKMDAYDALCNDAIKAGQAYQQYCDPGSAEYDGVTRNEQALKDSMTKVQSAYDNMQSDYSSKNSAQAGAQASAQASVQAVGKDYTDKLSKVNAAKTDLDSYESSETAMEKLNPTYINGFKQKVESFDALCGDAIAAGDACLPYLDADSADYKTVMNNKQSISDVQAHYDGQLSNLTRTYNNLHPLTQIK
jgi:hypothetical protein